MRSLITFAAVTAALAAGATASAQIKTGQDYYPYNFTIRGGVAIPLDSGLSDVAKTFINLGVDYTFGQPLLGGGTSYLSLDYLTGSLRGDKGTVFPLLINHRFYTKTNDVGRRSYVFAGVGVALIDVNTSNTVLAGRLGIGTELSDNVILETAAFFSDRSDTARANSIGITLGYRF